MIRIFLLISPIILFASVNVSNSDIIERSINFVIFIVILWYLIANKLFSALKDRQMTMASKLNGIQNELLDSSAKKDEALKLLDQTKSRVQNIIDTANKEALVISNNMEKQCMLDIETLNNIHNDLLKFEKNRINREVIDEVLDKLFKEIPNIPKDIYISMIAKRGM